MIADLFICDKSFAYNQIDSLQEINKKILQMKGLFDAIKKHKTDNKLRLQTENFIQTIRTELLLKISFGKPKS